MEREIDSAIEGLAKSDNPDDVTNPYLVTINNAPTTTKRRVKQSLALAQRLQQKQKECEVALKELSLAKSDLEDRNERLKITEDLLSKTNQPYTMLLGQIEDKEKEILKFRNTIKGER